MTCPKGTAVSSALALALLLAVPQLAGSVGTCREANCGTSEPKCDPSKWSEYERRKKVAEELFAAAKKRREEIKNEASDFFKEQLIGMGEVSVVKGPPVAAAGKLRQLALRYVGSTLSNMEEKMAALKQAQAFGAFEYGAEEIGGVAGTALWVYVLGEKSRQLDAEWAESENMSAEAQRQLDKALDAFKADFNQREACDKDRQKLKKEELLDDKAKKLMEEWENNGNLYKDPSGQILNSGAAFKRAKEILLKSTSLIDMAPHMWLTANSGGPSPGSVTVTKDQLEAAIKEVKKGISLLSSGMNFLIQELSAQDSFDSKLAALVRQF